MRNILSELKEENEELKKSLFRRSLWLLGIAVIGSIILAVVQGVPMSAVVAGVFGSLVASVIFYLLFSLMVEKTALTYFATDASETAVNHILGRFNYVPTRTYPEADTPDVGFERDYLTNLESSSFYWFKGISANFAAQRLQKLRKNGLLNRKQLRVLILHPKRRDLLEAYARMRLENKGDGEFNSVDVNKLADKKTEDIIKSLIQLHEIAQQCNLEVRFHDDFVFSRSEIFSDGIYLSYYDGGRPFPGSLYYSAREKETGNPSSVYIGYLGDFNHHYYTGEAAVARNQKAEDFESLLAQLGFNSQGDRIKII